MWAVTTTAASNFPTQVIFAAAQIEKDKYDM
jgi:hypothetical protein